MFGFIKAPCRSCSTESASEYRQWFCGLGCALSRDYSPLARFLVNHDSTFLALTAGGMTPEPSAPVVRTCCNPFSKPRPMQSDHWATQYAAAVTLCGLRVKAEDEADDERGIRRQLGRAAKLVSTPAADKATALLNTISFPAGKVWNAMRDREQVESPRAGIREAASPTAEAYREIFAHPGSYFDHNKATHAQLSTLGESMGRLVYWKDALDDREADAAKGRYNPLQYHREGRMLDRIAEEAVRFQNAATILATHAPLLPSLAEGTTEFHFAEGAPRKKRRKRRSSKNDDHPCSYCDCCPTSCDGCGGKGGFLDNCCDCCPGDCPCPCDC